MARTNTNSGGSGGGVQSVTGLNTNNTDPLNPVVRISVDGVTVTGDGTPGDPLTAVGGGTPSAPDTSIQWNNAGSFGGSADFTYDNTDKIMTLDTIQYRQDVPRAFYTGVSNLYITNNDITPALNDGDLSIYDMAIGKNLLNTTNDPENEARYSDLVVGINVLQSVNLSTFDSGENVVLGFNVMTNDVIYRGNTCIGQNIMTSASGVNSSSNIAIGGNNLTRGGSGNVAIGRFALNSTNSDVSDNIAIGPNSLSGSEGIGNIGIGSIAGSVLTTGERNTLIGNLVAGSTLETGSNNVIIGAESDVQVGSHSNSIILGAFASCTSSNQLVVGSTTSQITTARIGINSTDTNGMLYSVQNTGTDIAYGASSPRLRVGGSGLPANASALAEFNSTTQALLLPRMTTTQRDAIASPVAGLIIYNTTTNLVNFYNGSAWGAI